MKTEENSKAASSKQEVAAGTCSVWGLLIRGWQINNISLVAVGAVHGRSWRSLCCVSPGGFLKQPLLLQRRKWTWGALCQTPRGNLAAWPQKSRRKSRKSGEWIPPVQINKETTTEKACVLSFHSMGNVSPFFFYLAMSKYVVFN